MNSQMQAAWRKMVGAALLWCAISAAVFVPTSNGPRAPIAAAIGFIAFCSGLSLFVDGVKRQE